VLGGKIVKRVTSPDLVASWAAEVWVVKPWIKVTSMVESVFMFRFPSEDLVLELQRRREECVWWLSLA